MRNLLFLLLILTACGQSSDLVLVENGKSPYQIIVGREASASEQKAATELQHYLYEISGAELPILTDEAPMGSHEILIGNNSHLDGIEVPANFSTLSSDGFHLTHHGNNLIIIGKKGKGNLHGVYTLLEEYMGCRFWTSKAQHIPSKTSLRISPPDERHEPVFSFRENYYLDARDSSYMNWHKLHRHNGTADADWGLWVHTYFRLLSPDEYYESHPEYFAEINGRRMKTQLCLSNPEVLEIVVKNLQKEIALQPLARYWSVSQMDNVSYCQCDNCQKIDEKEGGPTGSVLYFTNQVASQFPEKIISTLAYQYSRPAPKTLKPAHNVNIMFCSIECNRSRPIATDSLSADFRKDMQDWAALSDDIVVWDYVIQFEHLLSPFPNLRVLQPNLQFFHENHATSMFQQGNREVGGEFAELRAYLVSKLLWDPYVDIDSVRKDFLEGYYGKAAPMIEQYITLMHDELEASGKGLQIFGSPLDQFEGYLSPDFLDRYEQLFDQAEAAVSEESALLERVQIARLPLEYASLEIARMQGIGPRGLFEKISDGMKINEAMRLRLENFVSLANRQGVGRVKEWHTSPDEYKAQFERLFEVSFQQNLATDKPVKYLIPYADKYAADGMSSLTDGKRGSSDWRHFWQGWKGENLQTTVDLGEIQACKVLELTCLQELKDWIFLPSEVAFWVSKDGEHFDYVGKVEHHLSEKGPGHIIKDFRLDIPEVKARYVRIEAKSIGTIPVWHGGAGDLAWLFADEIRIF